MISVYDKKVNCSGCTACKFICPTRAIIMIQDEEGFLYPEINQDLCIDCGKCREVCAFNNQYDYNHDFEEPKVLAVKHKDINVRKTSTSGGMFTAISDYILDCSGVVFGAKFDESMKVIHSSAVSKYERDNFKGSKYVQSDLNDTFYQIKKLLEKNNRVLFTGTPCQNAGLRSFLKNEKTENLITCDIVCHGVPSPLMWKEHVEYLNMKKKSNIKNYNFRSKILGWHSHNEVATFIDESRECLTENMERYKLLFHSRNILRPSCHKCVYTNFRRPSDITIADFWGIEKSMPEYDDNMGVSLVLINSAKGNRLFEEVKNSVDYRVSNINDCIQPNLKQPSNESINRSSFWIDYYKHGYKYVGDKYLGLNKKKKIKYLLKKAAYSIGVLKLYLWYKKKLKI